MAMRTLKKDIEQKMKKIETIKDANCSASLRLLEWDSGIFGFKIGRLDDILLKGDEAENRKFIRTIVEKLGRESYRHINCRIGLKDFKTLNILENEGFNIADIQITLTTKGRPGKSDISIPEGYRIRKAGKPDLGQLKIVTKDAFTDTRIVMDPGYPKDGVDRFYYEWVRNSVSNKRQTVFIAEEIVSKAIAGFVICDFCKNTGFINLISVKRSYRQCGVGAGLVRFALGWFSQRSDEVEVRTQVSNMPAIRLFMNNGFKELTSGKALPCGISMHYWRRKG